jgi:hypothetical protein
MGEMMATIYNSWTKIEENRMINTYSYKKVKLVLWLDLKK